MSGLSVENTALALLGAAGGAVLAAKQWGPDGAWTDLETGTLLALLALLQLAFGLRKSSGDSRNRLYTSYHLCLSVSWLAVGSIAVWSSYNLASPSQALLPTLAVSALLSLTYLIISMAARIYDLTLLAFLWTSSWVLAIVTLYMPASYQLSSAAVNSVLCLVSLFIAARGAVAKVKLARKEYKKTGAQGKSDKPEPTHLILLVYSCQTLAVSPAVFLTVSDLITPQSFALTFATSGVLTFIAWVAILRYNAPFQAIALFLYASLGVCCGLSLIYDVSSTAGLIILSVSFVFVTVLASSESLYHILQNIAYVLLVIALAIQGFGGMFFLVMCWIMLIINLYGILHYASVISFKDNIIPIGQYKGISKELLRGAERIKSCCQDTKKEMNSTESQTSSIESDILGFSKYSEIEMIGFLANAIAAVSVLWLDQEQLSAGLVWTLPVGGLAQFVVGCVCLSRGKSLESCSFIVCSAFWMLWSPVQSLTATGTSFQLALGPTAFLLVGIVLTALALVISKVWFFYSLVLLINPVLAICFSVGAGTPQTVSISFTALFALVCFYCFFGSASKAVLGKALVPFGRAVVKVVYGANTGGKVVMAPSKKARGVSEIAAILNSGGIVGIPTDTVYVLVAACKFPKAVERAYNTKKQAEDRPMSLWISDLQQLSQARQELGPLLWRFMNKVWPSSISLVIPKGAWLEQLGLGESEKYIGKPDSIAVRLPDYTVTTHLIEQVGPLAVTSANPSGEADTTHHSQVLARLGGSNCDGVLCDGASPENAASTVVDCRRLSQGGELGFFRIGITPKSKVLELFDQVKQEEESRSEQKKEKPVLKLTIADKNRRNSQLSPDIIVGHEGAPLDDIRVIHEDGDAEQGISNPGYNDSDMDEIDIHSDSESITAL